ncbi:hypothetical protein [Nocardiopsis sp. LOL_012]|uniref:hypothetical protein n=1 Tax=Nocardiopsis sp. LOL_012 TaxID=3345409 RepID=UPI003A841C45
MSDHIRLPRWRGHCLARLGHGEAIEDLTRALDDIAPLGLGRAEAGLRTDTAAEGRVTVWCANLFPEGVVMSALEKE